MKNKYFTSHKFILVIITVTIVLVALLGWKLYSHQTDPNPQPPSQINSFDECVAAGNAVMESYPEQCVANGKTFTKQY